MLAVFQIFMMTSSNWFFPRYWPFVRGIHRSPVNSPHKGQWRGALVFYLICVWINAWVNNREAGEAGDLRRHCAYYDVIIMYTFLKIILCYFTSVSHWTGHVKHGACRSLSNGFMDDLCVNVTRVCASFSMQQAENKDDRVFALIRICKYIRFPKQ